MKIDAALVSFSQCIDRFSPSGYKEKISFERQLDMASEIKGLTGVALDYPTQFTDPLDIYRKLNNRGLQLGMVEVDLFSSSKWKFGSLSSSDGSIRREAIDISKRAMDAAFEAGGADLQLWLGQDGYDYSFQANYEKNWEYLIEGIREIASHRDDFPVTIEYKLKEPRTKCHISTVGKGLFVINEINRPNVGATLDVGHSLMASENPAESAVLLMKFGKLFHLHLNDNYRDWDHDMIPGSVNLWETIELFYWLRKLKYDGWYGIDIYPYRENGKQALAYTINNVHKIADIAGELDVHVIEMMQKDNNPLEIHKLLWNKVLK